MVKSLALETVEAAAPVQRLSAGAGVNSKLFPCVASLAVCLDFTGRNSSAQLPAVTMMAYIGMAASLSAALATLLGCK